MGKLPTNLHWGSPINTLVNQEKYVILTTITLPFYLKISINSCANLTFRVPLPNPLIDLWPTENDAFFMEVLALSIPGSLTSVSIWILITIPLYIYIYIYISPLQFLFPFLCTLWSEKVVVGQVFYFREVVLHTFTMDIISFTIYFSTCWGDKFWAVTNHFHTRVELVSPGGGEVRGD